MTQISVPLTQVFTTFGQVLAAGHMHVPKSEGLLKFCTLTPWSQPWLAVIDSKMAISVTTRC